MATETHDAVEGAAHAAESAGMPQLDFSTWGNQIFWLIVTLVVIYLILSKIALPRVGAVLADRAGTIANNIAAADELKQKAKDAEAAYDKALADARAEASSIVEATRAENAEKLKAATAEADAKIAAKTAEGEAAIAEIRAGAAVAAETVAREAAAEIVSAMGFKASDEEIAAGVSSRLKG
ncbi:F-type H+-transporting ATPase subunit b [Pseudooceanicola antarcticus]|uniref:ATP synthase subunit b n=1 Tax=Pseudooceanicola antarcticus TaxID=1247613 RepID=A0A285IFZ8_9RHOB|nr:F0F1 ATP synthase subunit B' [Pseudooceanicola antarcticus]PJE29065.1 ATP F0F1 synthase subunit B' [Pseudooceanicola antarcticus]SNY46894.1 F-type H+-transporting ATPase subunit b [Pseudooceanicola antarcticus]